MLILNHKWQKGCGKIHWTNLIVSKNNSHCNLHTSYWIWRQWWYFVAFSIMQIGLLFYMGLIWYYSVDDMFTNKKRLEICKNGRVVDFLLNFSFYWKFPYFTEFSSFYQKLFKKMDTIFFSISHPRNIRQSAINEINWN